MFIRSIRKSTEASVREFVNIPQTCHLSKENKINFFSKDFLSYKPTKRLKTVGINVSLLYLKKYFIQYFVFAVLCLTPFSISLTFLPARRARGGYKILPVHMMSWVTMATDQSVDTALLTLVWEFYNCNLLEIEFLFSTSIYSFILLEY